MTKAVSTLVGVVLIVGVGGFVYWQNLPSASSGGNTEGTTQETGLTAAAVAMHKDATSCWAIINGNVYDLTSWIPEHPGGTQAILQLCGTDGSAKFNNMHGGQAMQEQVLAGFIIGTFEQ